MGVTSLFDVKKQLTFYGAYHTNPANVAIHMLCVPLLIWSFQVMSTLIPVPSFVPVIHYKINKYLEFDSNIAAIQAALYFLYYLALEPVAAVLYAPLSVVSVLTATAFAQQRDHVNQAALLHGVCWIAQFIGHGVAEKRAPALLDNLVGAVVLAPFFVHLELLFKAGYKPRLHKEIENEIGKEVTKIRRAQGDKRRARDAKAL
ncbi:hypothetical protein PLICRDRAFT_150858 [Plicaturopsis crispa FD-325 SS-3]|nr:hypothetical protein PLICRDRAFT_150858 [Plicaturopsis crispa FD-325 SS-3]